MLLALYRASVPIQWAWNRTPHLRLPGLLPGNLLLHTGPHLPSFRGIRVVILAVQDGAIASVGKLLAERELEAQTVVLHLSGSLPGEEAASNRIPHVHYGSWHPLQSLSGNGSWPSPFWMVCEGDAMAVETARALTERLGCHPATLPPGGKTLYHAAAVLASNLLVALEGVAMRTLTQAGIPAEEAMPLLHPLVRGTVQNLMYQSPKDALTGPIARGDGEVVARHLEALDHTDPAAARIYRLLGREALALIRERLSKEVALRVESLLSDGGEEENPR